MEIRRAKIQDVDAIQMVVRHNSKCFGFVMKCVIAESVKKGECFVVENNGAIIAFCRYSWLKTKKMTRIHEICTEKDFRGGHIAIQFLKKLKRLIIADCPFNNESNKWYARVGFTFSRRRKPNAKSRILNEWILY